MQKLVRTDLPLLILLGEKFAAVGTNKPTTCKTLVRITDIRLKFDV